MAHEGLKNNAPSVRLVAWWCGVFAEGPPPGLEIRVAQEPVDEPSWSADAGPSTSPDEPGHVASSGYWDRGRRWIRIALGVHVVTQVMAIAIRAEEGWPIEAVRHSRRRRSPS